MMALRTGYALVPYMLLAFTLSVVGRSTTMGVAGTLVYILAESIVLAVLGNVGGASADARAFFMGHNVSAVLSANQVGDIQHFSLALRESPTGGGFPEAGSGAIVLALYSLGLVAISFASFLGRDIR